MTGQRKRATRLDDFVAELQREIDAQERALYSAKIIEEADDPTNVDRMPDANVQGLVHGWCGDTMEIYLRLAGEHIGEAIFRTDGCGPTLACGSMLTSMVRGMTLEEASGFGPEDLIGYEGNAFALTGNVEADLLSITAVHPMREDAVGEFLAQAGAGWPVIHGLPARGLLVETAYGGRKLYMRELPGEREG